MDHHDSAREHFGPSCGAGTGHGAIGLRNAADGPRGFWLGALFEPREIEALRTRIEERLLRRVESLAPGAAARFRRLGLERYHEASHLIDHATAWPRSERLLGHKAIGLVEGSTGFARLREAFGPATISNEVEGGAPEVVWRLVRPGQPGDVGPLHADRWFWDINGWRVPAGHRPIKVWTLLAGETGRSGLRVVPGSHRNGGWRYSAEHRHGMDKPVFDEAAAGVVPELLETPAGTSVVFDYGLLHSGAVTAGATTRVSIEFTAFVPL